MKSNIINLLITIIYLVTIGFRSASLMQENEFKAIVDDINKKHSNYTNTEFYDYPDKYLPELMWNEIGFSKEELESLTTFSWFDEEKAITKEQAKEDIELLYKVLEYGYSGYKYLGRIAFNQAKINILKAISEFPQKELTTLEFHEIVASNLSFVKDGHFLINGENVYDTILYYESEETFDKDNIGYYKKEGNEKYYITSIEGESNIDSFMKLSISLEGKVVYRIGRLDVDMIGDSQTINIHIQDEDKEILLNQSEIMEYELSFQKKYNEEIPIVAVRDFFDTSIFPDFLDTAKELSKSPIAILDLRGNTGGWSVIVEEWLDLYDFNLVNEIYGKETIEWLGLAEEYFSYQSLINDYDQEEVSKYLEDGFQSDYDSFMKTYEEKNNNYNIYWEEFNRSDSKQLLFVLVDKDTASAGELLPITLLNKDNVIIVGTNTFGALLNNNAFTVYLPNSSMSIQCGNTICFYGYESFEETVGLEPDIWVGEDSLKSVLDLISYYQLIE